MAEAVRDPVGGLDEMSEWLGEIIAGLELIVVVINEKDGVDVLPAEGVTEIVIGVVAIERAAGVGF